MSVFNLLTDEDKDLIIRYVDTYAPNTDDAKIPSLSNIHTILAEWDTQKSKNLQKLFGDKLILNRPYTYAIAEDGVKREIEEAIDDNGEIYQEFRRWVRNTLCSSRLGLDYDIITNICSCFDIETLAANAYASNNFKMTFPDGEVWKVSTGMKPMKILHKIVVKFGGEYQEELYEDFRNWHSRLLNQSYLDGTLSLSIHPLDFMTMSDNGGSWSSCMRWASSEDGGPGDYRMGTVECMNSPYIIVAYLHNPNKKYDFWQNWRNNEVCSWNKKKWRELFIVQDGIISEIKGYPFQDENLTNTALMWIKELAHDNLGWDYDDVEVNVAGEYNKDGNVNMFKIAPQYSAYMYNDFGTLAKHRGRVNLDALKRRSQETSEISITEYQPRSSSVYHMIYNIPYGGKATCMCCGQPVPYYDNRTDTVLCKDCESTDVCPCCGEYYSGEGYYVSSYEEPICYSCYEYECSRDDLSEDMEYGGSLVDIRLLLGNDNDGNPVFYDNIINTLDPESFDNLPYQKLFSDVPLRYQKHYEYVTETIYYVTMDMIQDWDWAEEVFDIDLSDEAIYEEMVKKNCVEASQLAAELFDNAGVPSNA